MLLVQAIIAWSLFAFGGAYTWTLWPILAGTIWLAWRVRPPIFRSALDLSLAAIGVAIAIQLIPLPLAARQWLSPHGVRLQTVLSVAGAPIGAHPLSIDPAGTAYALILTITLLLFFWSTRELLRDGGVRRLVRAIAWIGLIVALVAIVQRALSPLLIYGIWQPFDRGARPFGPFVNRNHLVAWMLMAIPLSGGYALARSGAAAVHSAHRRTPPISVTVFWLIVASLVMTAAIFVSLSRTGIVGVAAIAAIGWIFARGRLRRAHAWWIAGIAAVALLAVVSFTNVPALLSRFDVMSAATGIDRRDIWRDTLGVSRDFWLTGTGAGTYQVAMLEYQTVKQRDVFFNEAHNLLLQFVAEGGLLMLVPLVAAIGLFAATARARLSDRSGVYWMRAAALTGLGAVSVQAFWETGLAMPANAVLFATLAAIVVHEPADAGR